MKKYSENGFWVKKEADGFVMGLSAKGQDDLGSISFVELQKTEQVSIQQPLVSVEAAKAVTELLSPLNGSVSAWHDELEDNPDWLNESDDEHTWIVKLTTDEDELFETLSDTDFLTE